MLTHVDKVWKGKYFPWVPEGEGINSMLKNAKDKSDEKKHCVQWHLSGLAGHTDQKAAWLHTGKARQGVYPQCPNPPQKTTSEYLCESGQTIEWAVFFRLFQEVALTRTLRPIEDTTESFEGVTKEKEECCQRT